MTPLAVELDRYLATRRGLGFALGTAERILRRFVAFAAERGAGYVTARLFLEWKEAFGRAGRHTWAARLTAVRLFAQWLHGLDARHEVPPRGLIPGRSRRGRPYIFSEREVERIVAEAGRLPSTHGLRGLTYPTLFGLLAVTGLRIGEAVALDGGDVDLTGGVLTVRRGKGGQERLVPVSDCTRAQLELYARERDRLLGTRPRPFFVCDRGRRVGACAARYNFAAVGQRIGLRPVQTDGRHGRGPRIHDLRHTFAVRTLVGWYRQGHNPDHGMTKLATYLGHANPAHTYWYVEAVPELLALASARAAREGVS